MGDKLNSESIYASEVQCSETELSASPNQNTEVLNCPVTISEVSKSNVTNEEKEVVQENNDEAVEEKKNDGNDGLDKCLDVNNKSSDVYLNIRLPNGSSLREKFSVISTLGMVKDHVDINQDSGSGPYDLAIPYPRKVFNDQGMFICILYQFPFFIMNSLSCVIACFCSGQVPASSWFVQCIKIHFLISCFMDQKRLIWSHWQT